MAKTNFFKTCRGVFQGGGCCAIALAGAYRSAVAHGVQFIEVAGTSAGSILAALIGAGATPDQVIEYISEIEDFGKFLAPPDANARPNDLGFFAKLGLGVV